MAKLMQAHELRHRISAEPLHPGRDEAEAVPVKVRSPLKTGVVLLGEDATVREQLRAALRSERCDALWTNDPHQALEAIRGGRADVLVVDFDTHSRSLSQLASGFSERRCRSLVLVGSLERLALASESGADGALLKPVDPRQARTAVHNLLAGVETLTPSAREGACG